MTERNDWFEETSRPLKFVSCHIDTIFILFALFAFCSVFGIGNYLGNKTFFIFFAIILIFIMFGIDPIFAKLRTRIFRCYGNSALAVFKKSGEMVALGKSKIFLRPWPFRTRYFVVEYPGSFYFESSHLVRLEDDLIQKISICVTVRPEGLGPAALPVFGRALLEQIVIDSDRYKHSLRRAVYEVIWEKTALKLLRDSKNQDVIAMIKSKLKAIPLYKFEVTCELETEDE